MSSHCGPAETNPTRNDEVEGRSLASISRLRIQHCRELWCRPAAVAPIRPLAWEFPYAAGEALKRQRTKKKREEKKRFTLWLGVETWAGTLSFSTFENIMLLFLPGWPRSLPCCRDVTTGLCSVTWTACASVQTHLHSALNSYFYNLITSIFNSRKSSVILSPMLSYHFLGTCWHFQLPCVLPSYFFTSLTPSDTLG